MLLVAVCYRTNLTMRQLAPLFGCSPATVRRVIHRLRPLLAIEPATRPTDAVDRLKGTEPGSTCPVAAFCNTLQGLLRKCWSQPLVSGIVQRIPRLRRLARFLRDP